MNEFEKLKLASCDLLGIAWGSLLPATRFIIYYIDPKKLHKHFGHFGSPKFRRESERERRTGRRERERGLLFLHVVQFLVLYFQFSDAISGATVTEISRQKQRKMKKTSCASLYLLFNCCGLAVSKQIKTIYIVEITTSHVSCGGRCM